jgi:quercetin dioxygenase-like cupin family protein
VPGIPEEHKAKSFENQTHLKGKTMNTKTAALILTSAFLTAAIAQDPVKTDGDKYKVILENERVRVFEYTDKPGDKTSQHHHPDFVLYALDPFKRRLTFPNGKKVEKEFKKGDVIWMKEQIHIGENIGKTDTHVLIVELKKGVAIPDTIGVPLLEMDGKKHGNQK